MQKSYIGIDIVFIIINLLIIFLSYALNEAFLYLFLGKKVFSIQVSLLIRWSYVPGKFLHYP